jgi:hypothetical protein
MWGSGDDDATRRGEVGVDDGGRGRGDAGMTARLGLTMVGLRGTNNEG